MIKVLLVILTIQQTFGSHWRFGLITWKTTTGTTVEFTAQLGWRSSFIGTQPFAFGDGNSIQLSNTECPTTTAPCSSDSSSTVYYELISTIFDLSGAETALIRYIFYHTYPSYSSYTYGFSSCCRVSGLVVGSSETYTYYGIVSLADGNTGSPITSIPSDFSFYNGIDTKIYLSPVDNDGDIVTCRKATSSESGISDNSFYSVNSSACIITMGESGSIGDKWAAQIIMETSVGDSIPIDFMFEAYEPVSSKPQCKILTGQDYVYPGDDYYSIVKGYYNGFYLVESGDLLVVNMEGSDDNNGDLYIESYYLPDGASVGASTVFNYENETTSRIRFNFSWTPDENDNGAFSASIKVFVNVSYGYDLCIIPILVLNGSHNYNYNYSITDNYTNTYLDTIDNAYDFTSSDVDFDINFDSTDLASTEDMDASIAFETSNLETTNLDPTYTVTELQTTDVTTKVWVTVTETNTGDNVDTTPAFKYDVYNSTNMTDIISNNGQQNGDLLFVTWVGVLLIASPFVVCLIVLMVSLSRHNKWEKINQVWKSVRNGESITKNSQQAKGGTERNNRVDSIVASQSNTPGSNTPRGSYTPRSSGTSKQLTFEPDFTADFRGDDNDSNNTYALGSNQTLRNGQGEGSNELIDNGKDNDNDNNNSIAYKDDKKYKNTRGKGTKGEGKGKKGKGNAGGVARRNRHRSTNDGLGEGEAEHGQDDNESVAVNVGKGADMDRLEIEINDVEISKSGSITKSHESMYENNHGNTSGRNDYYTDAGSINIGKNKNNNNGNNDDEIYQDEVTRNQIAVNANANATNPNAALEKSINVDELQLALGTVSKVSIPLPNEEDEDETKNGNENDDNMDKQNKSYIDEIEMADMGELEGQVIDSNRGSVADSAPGSMHMDMANDNDAFVLQSAYTGHSDKNINDIAIGAFSGDESDVHNCINWQEWTQEEVNAWVGDILRENKYPSDEIDEFVNNVFKKMKITGKILVKLKSNQQFWNKFQSKLENESFGMWVALSEAIENLS